MTMGGTAKRKTTNGTVSLTDLDQAPAQTAAHIEIPAIGKGRMTVRVIGDSSLIVHAWSEKAKKAMLDKQMKVAKAGREAKDPEQEYQDSFYRMPDGSYGFPAVGFKAAAVSACRFLDMHMTVARGAFHVFGPAGSQDMLPIIGEPRRREDMVSLNGKVADLRYRGEFLEWTVDLTVVYNTGALSAAQIINLFNHAGFGVGVGEWRPERDGPHGMFHVATGEEVQ